MVTRASHRPNASPLNTPGQSAPQRPTRAHKPPPAQVTKNIVKLLDTRVFSLLDSPAHACVEQMLPRFEFLIDVAKSSASGRHGVLVLDGEVFPGRLSSLEFATVRENVRRALETMLAVNRGFTVSGLTVGTNGLVDATIRW